MWWIIIFIAILIIVGISDAQSKKNYASMGAIYPSKLQVLLKEEFPSQTQIFTLSFCSLFWTETISFAKEKTGKKDETEALTKLETLYKKPKIKEQYDEEFFQLLKNQFPADFVSLLEDEEQRKKLDRATELAIQQAVAEIINN